MTTVLHIKCRHYDAPLPSHPQWQQLLNMTSHKVRENRDCGLPHTDEVPFRTP